MEETQTGVTLNLNELITTILGKVATLSADLDKAAKGNKSAAQRARVCSVELAKLFREYRKVSVHM